MRLARQQRQADEVIFAEAWRKWRQGRTREKAEAKAAWLFSNASGISVDSARLLHTVNAYEQGLRQGPTDDRRPDQGRARRRMGL
jgi:hypothetical protein